MRVLVATNRDLAADVKAGSFREDLYYRLAVFPLTLPALRDRRDDIGLLAEMFLASYASRSGRKLEPLSDSCMARLKSYDWPGNVRELQNVIERAVIMSFDGHIDLERALPVGLESAPPPSVAATAADQSILTVDELRQLEKSNLERALVAAKGKISGDRGAARRVGMNPSTFRSRMKALGIEISRP